LKPIIVDVSMAASWLLPDEHDARAVEAARALKETSGLVPQLWHYEMRNLVLMAVRRKRLSAEEAAERVGVLLEIPIETDGEPDLDAAFSLAAKYDLTYYDGLYLELARRRHASLATIDRRLLAAARSDGVAWE
jgi:predicted nucleic acid-binding protein